MSETDLGKLTRNNAKYKIIENKSTQRAQISLTVAVHYPQTAQIHDFESQHGDPDQGC